MKKISCISCCKQELQTQEAFEMTEPEERESLMAKTAENSNFEKTPDADVSTSLV